MADFVLPDKRAVIELDDGDYAGAEITARLRLPMAVMLQVSAMGESEHTREAWARAAGDLFCEWGLVSWNLADHRGPIPADREGWDRLDYLAMQMIFGAWLRGVVEPPAPLPVPSSAPTPSPAPHPSPRSSRTRARSRRS